eukprot:2810150-Rhodomonas_salina.2
MSGLTPSLRSNPSTALLPSLPAIMFRTVPISSFRSSLPSTAISLSPVKTSPDPAAAPFGAMPSIANGKLFPICNPNPHADPDRTTHLVSPRHACRAHRQRGQATWSRARQPRPRKLDRDLFEADRRPDFGLGLGRRRRFGLGVGRRPSLSLGCSAPVEELTPPPGREAVRVSAGRRIRQALRGYQRWIRRTEEASATLPSMRKYWSWSSARRTCRRTRVTPLSTTSPSSSRADPDINDVGCTCEARTPHLGLQDGCERHELDRAQEL